LMRKGRRNFFRIGVRYTEVEVAKIIILTKV
jgi:hypothetical protein